MANIVIGVDLGRLVDNSAVCVLEHVAEVHELPFPTRTEIVHRYEVMALRRWPLLTSYTTVVKDIGAMLAASGLQDAQLAVDATGIGKDVFDLFVNAYHKNMLGHYWPIPYIITGSGASDMSGDHNKYVRVTKVDIVGKLIAGLEGHLLTIPAELADAAHLEKELANFRRKISKRGLDTYAAEGNSDHDDEVSALLLSMWKHNAYTEPRRVAPVLVG